MIAWVTDFCRPAIHVIPDHEAHMKSACGIVQVWPLYKAQLRQTNQGGPGNDAEVAAGQRYT